MSSFDMCPCPSRQQQSDCSTADSVLRSQSFVRDVAGSVFDSDDPYEVVSQLCASDMFSPRDAFRFRSSTVADPASGADAHGRAVVLSGLQSTSRFGLSNVAGLRISHQVRRSDAADGTAITEVSDYGRLRWRLMSGQEDVPRNVGSNRLAIKPEAAIAIAAASAGPDPAWPEFSTEDGTVAVNLRPETVGPVASLALRKTTTSGRAVGEPPKAHGCRTAGTRLSGTIRLHRVNSGVSPGMFAHRRGTLRRVNYTRSLRVRKAN